MNIKKFDKLRALQYTALLAGSLLTACSGTKNLNTPSEDSQTGIWLTTGDQKSLLAKQSQGLAFSSAAALGTSPVIEVDDKQTYQSIDGFGYTLTGGSATLINKLPEGQKDALLKELFSADGNGIGVNYLRISVGASDLSAAPFSYNDLPAGQTDPDQDKFSIAIEQTDFLPILKRIVAINPAIKIMGSPWSAPTWMKDNNSFKGGSLKPEYYESYAKYFVKYIKAMKAEGITIDAITIQNEPLHPGNVPSMYMEAQDQANFIKTALGPAFQSAGIKTKIIVYDHNADRPDYPITILKDPEAAKYVDGSAFHLYGGKIDALSKVHEAFPNKNLYFTEQWVGGPSNFPEDLKWHVSTLIIGATRNWSKNVLEWNLAADPEYKPHTVGGCTSCLGAITIGQDVSRNVAYYIIGHASKFVPAGSVRIASNLIDELDNVAFKTPGGKTVLIVVNKGNSTKDFNIKHGSKVAATSLAAGAVATYIW